MLKKDKTHNEKIMLISLKSICLFVDKVDSLTFKKMSNKDYKQEKARYNLEHDLYRMVRQERRPIMEAVAKFGVSRATVYRIMSNFEEKNPQDAALMKKRGQDVVPEDYRKLQEEISELKKMLANERLRADFYEEMVAYGKEVYGIDLKKAGTK